MNNLVIVESPTKARTLARFLGPDYQIEASMGHIRDLPKGELGVNVEDHFEPKYVIPRDKKKKVNELKKLAEKAKTVYLASDPDREGEAISWHLAHLIGDKPIKRVEFHEITEDAIKEAFQHPREINMQLVDAQQARRVLDRLVGYKISPILWKKVKRGLSAGRVQTVALRLIVEREREIEIFIPIEYWSLIAELKALKGNFFAELIGFNGQKLQIWSKENAEKKDIFFIRSKEDADAHLNALKNATYNIEKIDKKEVRRYAPAPFTTSTLQQNAGNKLGFTAKKTMMLAQNLYEQGLITYMRTDSVNLASQAVFAARDLIKSQFGENYLPSSPRMFKSKSKNAQEAHEAIRPTNMKLTPDNFNPEGLTRDHKRLYELIWKRMIACQMADAVLDQTTVEVKALVKDDVYTLRANGSVLKFDGWLKLYGVKQEVEEEGDDEEKSKKQVLPELLESEKLDLLQLLPEQHFTQPPPRYTEASLIKKLEELGIGRPSTYAPTLATIQERFYVERDERKFKPTVLGMTTNDFLIKYFPETFDYGFTAQMEDELDEISRGERGWQQTIGEFYKPLESKLASTEETAEKINLPVETVDKMCPKCGKQLVVRTGKFGKFLACSGFPDCKHTEAMDSGIEEKCPKDGGDIVVRRTKKGRTFYGCKNYPNCDYASWTKPKSENSEQKT